MVKPKNLEKEFFVLDSNSLDSIKQDKLYGFCITKEGIIHNNNLNNKIEYTLEGAYVLITVDDDKITIKQDFNGSYGLYIFRKGDYFAISNSFFKLVNYLKQDNELTLNKNCADCFLFIDLCSISYKDTLVNEIKLIPRNYIISIDKVRKTLSYDVMDFEEYSVPIDSKLGFEILDEWYEKWINIIRKIKLDTNNLTIDLSGGFDSRMVAALWLTANIDLDKIKIKSHDNEVFKEEFKIVSKIADFFNFELNNDLEIKSSKLDDNLPALENSFNIKLGFHKQLYFKTFKFDDMVYSITGGGGESLRGYATYKRDDYIAKKDKIISKFDSSLFDRAKDEIYKSLNDLTEEFNFDENYFNLLQIHYNETRSRFHFGKSIIESYFSNMVTLTPLIDSNLRKLKTYDNDSDAKLLIAIIFLRYCPQLLDFEFDGGRKIDLDTINYAKELNEKYPYVKKDLKYISEPQKDFESDIQDDVASKNESSNFDNFNGYDYLKKIFYSKSFETEFKSFFSQEAYDNIIHSVETLPSHPLRHIYSAIAIILIKNLVKEKNDLSYKDILDSYLTGDYNYPIFIQNEVEPTLLKYITARFDVTWYNEENTIKILKNSDPFSKIKKQFRFEKNKFKKYLFISHALSLDLEIESSCDDKITFFFRSEFLKDINGVNFPIFIDCKKFVVDDEVVIENNTLVYQKDPLKFEKNVKKSDIIKIHLEWAPFNEDSICSNQFFSCVDEFEKLDSVLNSNCWKLTSIFRRAFKFFK